MSIRKRILQANLNNQGGAFSVAYEAQKELQNEYIFDYFFPDDFVENDVYTHLLSMGSRCVGKLDCNNRFLKQYELYKSFYKYLCDNNYDIVHIHSDTAWKISVYYLAAKRAGIQRIVVHSHSSGINGHYKTINYLLHLITKPIIKSAKYKCACSKIAAQWMFDTTETVSIIRNGVDIDKFKFNPAARENVRKELKIERKKVIGSVSDFSPQKSPEFIYNLVKAFQNDEQYIFLFVGNRASGCDLKKLIDDDASIGNVIFAGAVTNVPDYLSAMDTFILPSRFEGLPMCALEAQVNGLYTIVSDKVTDETRCSKYFSKLHLDIATWKKEIQSIDFVSSRSDIGSFLDFEKASSTNMADEFKKIYTE
ncbi:glycosyltransferase [Lacrimispora sp. JR3]|uniref:glycosyltransferase n=1 Tax=Lacrimispora sinapis TaxID=3111456 RepID=UPI003747AA25